MKVKILHINNNFLHSKLHLCMIEHLYKYDNIKNSIFVPMYDLTTSEYTNEELLKMKLKYDIKAIECFNRIDRLFFHYKQYKIFKAIQQSFNISEFNCIHAHTLFTDGNVAFNLSKKYKIPFIVTVRNTDVNDFFGKMIHLRRRGVEILRSAQKIIFLSETYRLQVFEKFIPNKYYDELLNKTYIIPNGIDDFWFKSIPSYGRKINNYFIDEIRLVFAGYLNKNKNIPLILKAKNILKNKRYNIKLSIAGKIEDKKIYKIILQDKDTEYMGYLSMQKLKKLYEISHIYVMPSIHESFGLVYAEAMSQGLPVIYTQGQGFDGQFPEGEVGYHVDSASPESVANAIEKVIKNFDKLSSNTISNSYKFQWDKIVPLYVNIYEQI